MGLLRCDVIRECDLDLASDEDIRNAYRRLEEMHGCMPPKDFEALEQAIGFTFHPHAVLLNRNLDDVLKPAAVFVHDWMHGLVSDGQVNIISFCYSRRTYPTASISMADFMAT